MQTERTVENTDKESAREANNEFDREANNEYDKETNNESDKEANNESDKETNIKSTKETSQKHHVYRLAPCPAYDVEGMESWLRYGAERAVSNKGRFLCRSRGI